MSQIFKKVVDGIKVNVEVFTSASECAKTCETREITDSRFNDIKKEACKSWHGADYQEAMELLRNGYQPTVEALRGVFKANVSGNAKRFKFQNNVVGFAPVVPLALMGVPNSMIDVRMTRIKAKVIDIYFDMTCNAGISSGSIMEASKEILSAVMELEQQGYRFNLYSCSDYCEGKGADMLCVKVKSAEQPLDLKRVSFPMTHTAFFRVLGFDWYSKFPIGKYRCGYGRNAFQEFGAKESQEIFRKVFGKSNLIYFSAQALVNQNRDVKYIKEVLENGNSKD